MYLYKHSIAMSAPVEEFLFYVVLGGAFAAVCFITFDRRIRESFLQHVPAGTRGRRISSSKTPPRSLTPERRVPTNAPHIGDYKDVFPPSPRESLPDAAKSLPLERQQRLRGSEVDDAELKKNVIPFTADYRECGPSTHTCMKVSMDEIRALGDFPDYASLSGIPLPEPYKEFKIETATFRPYRPFRWAYHQTMCMCAISSLCRRI